MNLTIKRALGSVVLAAGLVVAVPAAAHADTTTPGWEPDAYAQGVIDLYDADGNVVTGGVLNASPTVKYAVATGPGRTGDSKAALFLALPLQGVDPANWGMDQLTASTDWPNTSAPSVVASSPYPVSTGEDGDLSFADIVDEFPNRSTVDGYAGLYELRLYSAPGGVGSGLYYRLDISVDTTDNTWAVVYPTA